MGFCWEAVDAGAMNTVPGLPALCGVFRITYDRSLAVLSKKIGPVFMLALAKKLMFRVLLNPNL